MTTLSTFTKKNLNEQGFGKLDDKAKASYALPLRFTPAAGTALIVIGLALQSPIWLGAMALVAFSGALFPSGMLIDLVYNHGIRHLFGAPPLPPTPKPRQFSYLLSTAFLAGSALSFHYGLPVLGFILGGQVVIGSAILTSTLWCLGSWWYRLIFGYAVTEQWIHILLIMLFVTLAKSRMVAIEQALAAEKGFVSQTFYELVNDPILWISIQTRTAILLGIVFLKIAKPDLGGSMLIISVVIIPGLALALPMSRHRLTDLCQLLALRRICLAERGDGAVHSYAIPLDAFLDVGFLPQTEARIVCSINLLYSTEICHLIAGTKWRK